MYPLDKDFLPKMFNSFVCSFFKHYMEDVAFTTPPHTAHLKCLRCQLRDLQPPQPHYGSALKHPSASAEGLDSIPGLGRSPERGNGKSLLGFTWKTPRTEEPGGLNSLGSQRVEHDWAANQVTCHFCLIYLSASALSGLSVSLVLLGGPCSPGYHNRV